MEIIKMIQQMQNKQESNEEIKLSNLSIYQRKYWYSRVFSSLEICKFSRNREMSFLTAFYDRSMQVRYLNIAFLDILYKNLGIPTTEEKQNNSKIADPWRFFQKNYNIYCSLAKFDWSKFEHKAFSFDMEERKKQQDHFKLEINNLITDFNGAFEFDGNQDYVWKINPKTNKKEETKISLDLTQEEEVERALKDLKILLKVLDRFNVMYFVNFSGNRGFHVWYNIDLNKISVNKKMYLANEILQEIATTLNLKTLDRVRLNKRKVLKASYSICSNPKTNKTFVVLPLDENQINNFKLEDMELNNVYKKIIIKNRGVIWRNSEIKLNERIKCFERFLKDFSITIPKGDVDQYGERI